MSTFVPLFQHVIGPIEVEPVPIVPAAEGTPLDLDAERSAAFEEGRRAGREEREPEVLILTEQVRQVGVLIDELARARRTALGEAAADVAQIVVEVTRKVLHDTLVLHPDALPGLVLRAIERLPEEDEVWIRVPPSAVERVSSMVPERHRDRVRGDPDLTTGCIVETRHVAIDASLDATMDAIAQVAQAWVAGQS